MLQGLLLLYIALRTVSTFLPSCWLWRSFWLFQKCSCFNYSNCQSCTPEWGPQSNSACCSGYFPEILAVTKSSVSVYACDEETTLLKHWCLNGCWKAKMGTTYDIYTPTADSCCSAVTLKQHEPEQSIHLFCPAFLPAAHVHRENFWTTPSLVKPEQPAGVGAAILGPELAHGSLFDQHTFRVRILEEGNLQITSRSPIKFEFQPDLWPFKIFCSVFSS